jgi:hypothetical protein
VSVYTPQPSKIHTRDRWIGKARRPPDWPVVQYDDGSKRRFAVDINADDWPKGRSGLLAAHWQRCNALSTKKNVDANTLVCCGTDPTIQTWFIGNIVTPPPFRVDQLFHVGAALWQQ